MTYHHHHHRGMNLRECWVVRMRGMEEGGWCPADRREYDTCSLSYCTVSYCTLPYCNTLALSYCNALALSYRNALELYVQYTYTVRAILLHCVILQYTAVTFCTALSNYITVTYCSELPCINILLCSVKLQCISQQFRQLHYTALNFKTVQISFVLRRSCIQLSERKIRGVSGCKTELSQRQRFHLISITY